MPLVAHTEFSTVEELALQRGACHPASLWHSRMTNCQMFKTLKTFHCEIIHAFKGREFRFDFVLLLILNLYNLYEEDTNI